MARPVLKRDAIERAVVQIIAAKGLHATSIKDIARVSGVSPGLLYRYWTDRDDLAAAVYRRHFDDMLARLIRAARGAPDEWSELAALVREFLQFADEQPLLLKFLLLSQHDLAGSVPAEQGVRTLLLHALQRAREAGVLRPIEPDLAMQFLLGLVLQPVVGMIYGDVAPPVSSRADAILDALARVLRAAPAERARRGAAGKARAKLRP